MSDSALRLTVIIVNWNTGELLRKCLESVRTALRGLPAEVIVVDNASTDRSECVVETEFPEFRLLRPGANIGFGRANNLAACETQGKYLLFLNPDTTVRPDTFRILLELAGDCARPTIIGCRVRLGDGRVQPDSCGWFLTPGRWWLTRLHAERLLPSQAVDQSARLQTASLVDWISGVCLLVKREVFETLGGFDERMFAYLEDMDLCRRARASGTRSFFTTATEIDHFKGASFAGLSFRQTSYFLHSQILYVNKHWPWLARSVYFPDRFLRYAMLALWSGVTGNWQKRSEARELMSMVVAGGSRERQRRSNS